MTLLGVIWKQENWRFLSNLVWRVCIIRNNVILILNDLALSKNPDKIMILVVKTRGYVAGH